MTMAERLALKARAVQHTERYKARAQHTGHGHASGVARTAVLRVPATVGWHRFLVKCKTEKLAASSSGYIIKLCSV